MTETAGTATRKDVDRGTLAMLNEDEKTTDATATDGAGGEQETTPEKSAAPQKEEGAPKSGKDAEAAAVAAVKQAVAKMEPEGDGDPPPPAAKKEEPPKDDGKQETTTDAKPGEEVPSGSDGEATTDDDPNARGTKDEQIEQKVEFDPALLARGATLGFSKEDAENVGDPKVFETMLNSFSERLAVFGAPPVEPGAPQPPPTAPPPQQQPPPETQPSAPEGFKIELDPEAVEPPIVETFNKLNDHYAAQMAEMQGALGYALAVIQQQQTQSTTKRLDGYFAGLGEEFEPVVGKGTIAGLNPEFAQVRGEIVTRMTALAQGFQRIGRPVPPEDQLFQEAVNAVCAGKFREIEAAKVSAQLEKRKGGHVSRPTRRQPDAPTDPTERAVSKVAEQMEEMGVEH